MQTREIQAARRRGRGRAAALVILAITATAQTAPARDAVVSGADARREIDVTVYNQNLALVREVRAIALPEGEFPLEFRDVPSQIEPRSLLVETTGGTDLHLVEQNYEFDLMSREKILEKYVGREISWIQEDGSRVRGRLLGNVAGPVFEVDGEVLFEVPGRIALPDLPANLRARPTLVWRAVTRRAGEAEVQASYLTRGLSWSTDYVLQLDPAGKRADLQAWVSLDNRSGATYSDARILLVAGDIHQAPPPQPAMLRMAAAADKEAAYGGVTEETLYDYHLYTLPVKTELKDAQIKQVSLFEADEIAVQRHYRLDSSPGLFRGGGAPEGELAVQVFYTFRNEEENNLGVPLPAGVFRVYGQSSAGNRQLLGEDRIRHTPRDEEVELQVGAAFDITAERTRKDYRRLGDRTHETAFEIVLRNHKDEDVVVEVTEYAGGEWRLLQHSHPFEKVDAGSFRFDVPVEADAETILSYTVQVTY